jgi:hypothetical protein
MRRAALERVIGVQAAPLRAWRAIGERERALSVRVDRPGTRAVRGPVSAPNCSRTLCRNREHVRTSTARLGGRVGLEPPGTGPRILGLGGR